MNTMTLDDPIARFSELYTEAGRRGTAEPDAMVLSTVDENGRPSGRYVLLKDADHRGFVFFTNLESRKARDLAANPYAALCFYWPAVDTQVRVEGTVEPVADRDADDYFATRPAGLADRRLGLNAERDARLARVARAAHPGRAGAFSRVARCRDRPFWSGFRVVPASIEFWTRHPARLHDRALYTRTDGRWVRTLLYP
jgi:pyridoxamine 5'-phosphate oxidase